MHLSAKGLYLQLHFAICYRIHSNFYIKVFHYLARTGRAKRDEVGHNPLVNIFERDKIILLQVMIFHFSHQTCK